MPITPYEDELVKQELNSGLTQTPAIAPEIKGTDWLSAPSKPYDFTGAASGVSELHQEGLHEMKKDIGMGLARGGGGITSDPEEYINSAIRGNKAHNPLYDYEAKGIVREGLKKYPEANAKYEEAQADKQRVNDQGITPAMEQIRGQLPEEWKGEFDNRLSAERLGQLLPSPEEKLAAQQAEASPVEPSPNKPRDRRSGGEKSSDIAKSSMQNTLKYRLDNGLIDENTYMAAMSEMDETNRAQYVTTNSGRGGVLASALGLPDEMGGGITSRGEVFDGETYRVAGAVAGADAQSRADVAGRVKVETDAAKALRDAAKPKTLAEQEAYDRRLAKEKLGRETKKDADWAAMPEIQIINGQTYNKVPSKNGGTYQTASGKKLKPGIYGDPSGWLVMQQDGKSRLEDKNKVARGDDGGFWPLVDIDADDPSKGKKAAFPDKVHEYVKPVSTNPEDYKAGETVERAGKTWKKRADGKWEEVTDA